MKKKLVIVESPGKISKITNWLGPNYIVKASMGHVMDLPQHGLGIDINKNFEPTYQVLPRKKDVVADLKKISKQVDEVYLAQDGDREGHFISYAVKQLLDRKDLKFHRIIFYSITKDEILKAIKNPGDIDSSLVEAQQTRRLLDRLTGFKISPLLWKRKDKSKEDAKKSLSAGRVQSVGLQILADRQKEIDAFIPQKYWTIDAVLSNGSEEIETQLVTKDKMMLNSQEVADKLVTFLQEQQFIVDNVECSKEIKNPPAPFTTSTLQQKSSSILNWSSKKTMAVAQTLYENSSITYMRTDSVELSDEALGKVRVTIPTLFGNKYLPSSAVKHKGKSKNAQEAHEAVRAINLQDALNIVLMKLAGDENKLLEMIWRRTMACQMTPAEFDKVEALIKAGKGQIKTSLGVLPLMFKASGQVQVFDGYLKAWVYTETKELKLPDLKKGQELKLVKIAATEHETKPPARYTEASLIKELEANGVGRPSTFSSIIETLIDREYMIKDAKALVPTALGMQVSAFLSQYFPNIINVNFTSQLEEGLDKIAKGEYTRLELLNTFWKELKETIQKAEQDLGTNEVSTHMCLKCKSQMFVKLNRTQNQRFLVCSNKQCGKTFDMNEAGTPVERQVEKLNTVCPSCGGDLIKRQGKYGIFYGCSGYKNGCKVTADAEGKIKVPSAPPEQMNKKCPQCKKGNLIARQNKATGDKFICCDKFPKCKYTKSYDDDSTTPKKKKKKGEEEDE